MIITVAQQKEMAWNNIECQIANEIKKCERAAKRSIIKSKESKMIANGMDHEIAKVLAKVQFEYNF